jgi:hypothetical protein
MIGCVPQCPAHIPTVEIGAEKMHTSSGPGPRLDAAGFVHDKQSAGKTHLPSPWGRRFAGAKGKLQQRKDRDSARYRAPSLLLPCRKPHDIAVASAASFQEL